MSIKNTVQATRKNQIKPKPNNKLKYTGWGLVIFSFLLYVNTVSNSYNLDDELVTKNHRVTGRGFAALFDIFTQPYYTDDSDNVYEYRPVVLASFAIEHQFFGDNPGLSHLINALLYSLLIFILFKVLLALFHNYGLWLSISICLLFASHPIHTEVVASIKNRDEILALTGGLLSLLIAVKYVKTQQLKYLLFSVFIFLMAVLSKKSILPFALIIPLSLIMFLRPGFKQLIILTLCYALLGAVSSFFFDINVRILFFTAIILAVLFFWLIGTYKTTVSVKSIIKEFIQNYFYNPLSKREEKHTYYNKNDLYVLGIYFFINILLLITGIINNSKYILSFGFILSTFIYFFSRPQQKDILLCFPMCMSLFLLIQTGMVTPVLIFLIFFFSIINYRNIFHLVCIGILFLPVILAPARYLIFVFYYFVIALSFVLIRTDKKHLVFKLFCTTSALISIVVNIVWERFSNETVFITIIFTLLSVLSLSNILPDKKYYFKKIIIIIIPLALITELFLIKGYNESIFSYINTTALSEATEIMPASGRFLDFAEMPIHKETPFIIRTGTAFVSLAFYLKMLIFPHPLGFYYGYDMVPIVTMSNHWALISFFIHLVFLIYALIKFRTDKILSFGILYYLICISIFSNIVAPVAGVVAERLVFTASLGFCIVLVCVLSIIFKIKWFSNKPVFYVHKGFISVLIVIVFLYGFKTLTRNKQWENHLSLFGSDMSYLNRSAQAHQMYASALMDYLQSEKNAQKKPELFDKAILHYKEAINIYPEFYNASYLLAKAYFMTERLDDALMQFEYTLNIDSTSYMIYMYVALIYDQKNNTEKAIEFYRKTLQKEPLYIDPYTNLSALYMKENRVEEAINTNLKILSLKPDAYEPLLNLGKIYFSTAQLELADEYFEKAYQISDKDKNLINALYEINRALGRKEKMEFYLNKLKMS